MPEGDRILLTPVGKQERYSLLLRLIVYVGE